MNFSSAVSFTSSLLFFLLAAEVLPQALPQSVSGRDFPSAVSHLCLARPWDCLWQGRARRDFQRWQAYSIVFKSPLSPAVLTSLSCQNGLKQQFWYFAVHHRLIPLFMPCVQMTDSQNMEKWSLFSHLDQRKYMVRFTVYIRLLCI